MPVSQQPPNPSASAVAPKRILVVDDIPEICELFRSLHRRIRLLPTEFTFDVNSARALNLVREAPYDLVISDFRMREVDGIEILQAARERNPQGRRILMTGYNEIPTSMERITAADIDAYVQKPLKTQEVLVLMLDMLTNNEEAISAYRRQAREIETLGSREETMGAGRHSASWA